MRAKTRVPWSTLTQSMVHPSTPDSTLPVPPSPSSPGSPDPAQGDHQHPPAPAGEAAGAGVLADWTIMGTGPQNEEAVAQLLQFYLAPWAMFPAFSLPCRLCLLLSCHAEWTRAGSAPSCEGQVPPWGCGLRTIFGGAILRWYTWADSSMPCPSLWRSSSDLGQGPCTITWWREAMLMASLVAGVALVSPVGDWHASVARWDAPSCCSPPILC